MRIERVVAGTFSEASERARQRFGRDALVLSTSKVGNVTEMEPLGPVTDTEADTW